MIGTVVNAVGIAVGASWVLARRPEGGKDFQQAARLGLGVAIIWVGLSTSWGGFGGNFKHILGQLGVTLLSLSLGNITGRWMGIQKQFNRLGNLARQRFEQAAQQRSSKPALGEGLSTCSILFCATPLGLLGAVLDGIALNNKPLLVKAAMDALAAASFATVFGSSVLLTVIPLLAFQGSLTLLVRWVEPVLHRLDLVDSISCVAGLLVFCVALVVFEIKRLEIANYLPSLVYAPLITWLVNR
jgi:uncharacterized protein